MSLGPLFGLPPSPIFVVPVGTALTSGLAVAWRVLAFPALGWPARLDFLRQGHGPLELIGFGAPFGVVLPAGDSVLLSAFLTPRLFFYGRFAAVSAEAAGFGVGEFLLMIGSLYFSPGLGRQWDSFLFGILRYDYFLWSLLFGIICFCLLGNASVLFGRYSWVCSWSTFSWKREGMLEYNSFRILCGGTKVRRKRSPSGLGSIPACAGGRGSVSRSCVQSGSSSRPSDSRRPPLRGSAWACPRR